MSSSSTATRFLLCLALVFVSAGPAAAQDALTGAAADLFRKAQSNGHWYADAAKLKPELVPTSDGRSFLVVWRTQKAPQRWIVSLHGTNGYATDDLALWYPHLKDRNVGLVCVQWWLGTGDGIRDYYMPLQIYREIDLALSRLGVRPGAGMLHGFSRGAANSYAVAAIDAGRGKRYFSLAVASSGGAAPDYPPNRALVNGEYGNQPLKGTRWIMVAGGRDQNPQRDGIPGMKRTASWLGEQGAVVVEAIEDPDSGHGALILNPRNARRVLDAFLK